MTGTAQSVTQSIVDLVSDSELEAKAGVHFDLAAKALADTIAVMVAGAEEAAPVTVRSVLIGLGTGPGRVAGSDARLPVLDAILVNGTSAHALDFDDTIQGLTTHPSCHLVPVLLGLAHGHAYSSSHVLTSYLVGLQVEHYMANLMNPGHYQLGWHATSTIGTIATAAAASRLLRLSGNETRMAVGIAASSAAGLRANFGTMTKPLHAGHAASLGAQSALLAIGGLTSSPDSLAHRLGYLNASTRGIAPAEPIADLDTFPVTRKLAFKPYPTCGEAMGAVEACVALHPQIPPVEQADSVVIRIGPFAREMLEFDEPATPDEARFSAQYCAWKSLQRGLLTPSDFTDEVVTAIDWKRVSSVMSVIVDDSLEHERAAVVTVDAKGNRYEEGVMVPQGDPTTGFDYDALRGKFLGCVEESLGRPSAQALLSQILSLNPEKPFPDVLDALAR